MPLSICKNVERVCVYSLEKCIYVVIQTEANTVHLGDKDHPINRSAVYKSNYVWHVNISYAT